MSEFFFPPLSVNTLPRGKEGTVKGKYFEMLPGLNRDSVKRGLSHVLFIPFLNLGAMQSSTEDLEDGVGEKQANSGVLWEVPGVWWDIAKPEPCACV